MIKEIWNGPKINKDKISELKKDSRLYAVPDIVLNILINRGFTNADSIVKFLKADINDLHDTMLMKDADLATNILLDAIKNNYKIVISTDFDVDGCAAAAVGVLALRGLGANADYYVNNRFTQGYGLCKSGIDEILKNHPDVKIVMTADNGTTAFDAINYAKERGLIVIVTDHHEPDNRLPNADAIVNVKRHDETYPCKFLCGAGVVFKLMCLLYKKTGRKERAVYKYLDIVALATVADVVPILDENRIFVHKGLMLMNMRPSKIFQVFAHVCGIKTEVNSHHTLGYVYGPMINAIGRLDGSPEKAIDMFLSDDNEFIKETIGYLSQLNKRRQEITDKQTKIAEGMIDAEFVPPVIVLYSPNFHEGIIGLIAGKLKEKFNRPSIILTKTETGIKGSARSVDGFHIKEVFDELSDCLLGYGGHAKAAGFSIAEEKINEFRIKIDDFANKKLNPKDFVKKYTIDSTINEFEISEGIVNELKMLEPYGEGFPKPVILVEKCKVVPKYLTDGKHVKLITPYFPVLLWNKGEEYKIMKEPKVASIIGFPELNTYNGITTLQFCGYSFKPSKQSI